MTRRAVGGLTSLVCGAALLIAVAPTTASGAPARPGGPAASVRLVDSYRAVLERAGLGSRAAVALTDGGAVVRALPAAVEAVRRVLPRADVVADATADAAVMPIACTNRENCGAPLRGGVEIDGPYGRCSLGFTARATDGSRWVLSAGHCARGLDEPWQHGEQPIGVVRQRVGPTSPYDSVTGRSSLVDFMRVRISNSYWLNSTFGWMYSTPSGPVPVDGVVAASTLTVGQTICRSSWSPSHADLAPNCGTVVSNYGPNGEIEVNGMVVCHGDSGGSVYVGGPNGTRLAVGIISAIYVQPGTDPACVQSGYHSLISPMDAIYHYMDATTTSNVRLDQR